MPKHHDFAKDDIIEHPPGKSGMPSKIAEAQFFHVAEEMGLHSNTLHLNGDPVDPIIIEHFVYEVREKFAERAKRRELHPVHEPTVLDISKDFLKEMVRGLPGR